MMWNGCGIHADAKTAALLSSLALALAGCNSPPAHEPPARKTEQPTQPPVPPDRATAYDASSVIVRFRPELTPRTRALVLDKLPGARAGHPSVARWSQLSTSGELALVALERSTTVESALAELRADPAVLYAEPNYLLHALATPDDPSFSQLWGLHNEGQLGGVIDADIDAPEAWELTTGDPSVVVGVIDTGIDYHHADLAANMWSNPGELPGNGLDDDGNGVIDDVHGYDALGNSGAPLDDNDHGSHCAGTIGAVGDNNLGVAGVNWNVSLMALKFLSAGGSGTTADAIEAINYAIARKQAGVNLRVLSNSWGGGAYSQALYDAIAAANTEGILFVAAAGNYGSDSDASPMYPAAYDLPNIVSVAATDQWDDLAWFSNYGATTVDLGAPGVSVLSTTRFDTYQSFSGTSMATPHVAGAAALLLAANPTLSTEELKALLLDTGDPLTSLADKTVSGKRLNAAAALAEAGPPVPRFALGAAPAHQVLNQGGVATFTLDLTPIAGFSGEVALTVAATPTLAATIELTPPLVAVPGTSSLTVQTTTDTIPGDYELTITGTSGSLSKSRKVTLRVRPFGTVELEYDSIGTPVTIPQLPAVLTNTIQADQPLAIAEVQVDLDITHWWIGDLRVSLTAPDGTTVMLHDRTGGGTNDIHKTYTFTAPFVGDQAFGAWTLKVDDWYSNYGTLDHWRLRLIGVPTDPEFALAVTPTTLEVVQSSTSSLAVAASPMGPFQGDVSYAVTATPAFAGTLAFSAATTPVPGSTSLTAATTCDTPAGTYALTVTGTSGALSKTAAATLVVAPFGKQTLALPGAGTPASIPDGDSTGLTSSVIATGAGTITALEVEVHIAHNWTSDLEVNLIGPAQQTVVLHYYSYGTNIDRTYRVTEFDGQLLTGEWKLQVVDRWSGFGGTLTSWTLRPTVIDPLRPVASFSAAATKLKVAFTDASTDAGCRGGAIVARTWSFGDGATSNEQHPEHTYTLPGTYPVSLTVTDDEGLTHTTTQELTVTKPIPLAIERVTRNRARSEYAVDLTWSGADGVQVELWRNGALADLPDNDGVYRDAFRRYETAFTWKVCEQRLAICSNEVGIVFGADASRVTLVTRDEAGLAATRELPIVDLD